MLICGQFIAKDLILQSNLLFVCFGKLNFSDFWGPQNLLKKDSTFGFLTFENALKKTKPWADHFKDIVLYLLSCLGYCMKRFCYNVLRQDQKSVLIEFRLRIIKRTCYNVYNFEERWEMCLDWIHAYPA